MNIIISEHLLKTKEFKLRTWNVIFDMFIRTGVQKCQSFHIHSTPLSPKWDTNSGKIKLITYVFHRRHPGPSGNIRGEHFATLTASKKHGCDVWVTHVHVAYTALLPRHISARPLGCQRCPPTTAWTPPKYVTRPCKIRPVAFNPRQVRVELIPLRSAHMSLPYCTVDSLEPSTILKQTSKQFGILK